VGVNFFSKSFKDNKVEILLPLVSVISEPLACDSHNTICPVNKITETGEFAVLIVAFSKIKWFFHDFFLTKLNNKS
jgi:hypothetical protein